VWPDETPSRILCRRELISARKQIIWFAGWRSVVLATCRLQQAVARCTMGPRGEDFAIVRVDQIDGQVVWLCVDGRTAECPLALTNAWLACTPIPIPTTKSRMFALLLHATSQQTKPQRNSYLQCPVLENKRTTTYQSDVTEEVQSVLSRGRGLHCWCVQKNRCFSIGGKKMKMVRCLENTLNTVFWLLTAIRAAACALLLHYC
jgi:hypothetical protein